MRGLPGHGRAGGSARPARWGRLALAPGVRRLAALGLVLGLPAFASGEPAAPAALRVASVHFEQNATDGDVEVVFRAKGRKQGLAKLTVVSPDGRTVVDFRAPDASTLGMRQFAFESPEPADVAGLKAAYPEGVYRFSGATASGALLSGESTLSHQLPPTTSFVHPAADAEGVAVEGLEIRWSAVPGVAGYVVEIGQHELGLHLETRLPASASSLALPAGFVVAGREYDLGIGTVSKEGNISFVETSFTTAE